MLADRVRRPVEMRMPMWLVEPLELPVWAWWSYGGAADPLAVHLLFESDDPAEWGFARDLLRQGLAPGLLGPAGDGDLRLWHRQGWLHVAMVVPEARVRFRVALRRVEAFLAATYAWVPPGEELAYLDLDATAGRLLYGGGAR